MRILGISFRPSARAASIEKLRSCVFTAIERTESILVTLIASITVPVRLRATPAIFKDSTESSTIPPKGPNACSCDKCGAQREICPTAYIC